MLICRVGTCRARDDRPLAIVSVGPFLACLEKVSYKQVWLNTELAYWDAGNVESFQYKARVWVFKVLSTSHTIFFSGIP